MLFKCIIILIHVLGDRVKDVYIDYFETEDYLPESSLVNTVEYIWQSHGFYNSLNCGLRACIESLMTPEKFRISERKVQIMVMIGYQSIYTIQ